MLGDERPEVASSDGEGRPDGTVKAKGKPGRKPRQLEPDNMTKVIAELGKVFSAQTESNRQATLDAIRELKKPTAKEIREEAEAQKKELRIAEIQLRRVEDAKKEEARKASMVSGCSHSFYNPATKVFTHAWVSNGVSTPDGVRPYFVPTCGICNFQLKDEKGNALRFPATVHMLSNGVNLDQIPYLDIEKLKAWYKQATEQSDREAKSAIQVA